jgi:hypothetical protein
MTRHGSRGSRGRLRGVLPGTFMAGVLTLAAGVMVPPSGASPLAAQSTQRPPVGTAAQQAPPTQLRQDRQQMMLRIQRDLEMRLARELELSPRQLEGLRRIMVESRGVRGDLMRERFQLRQDMNAHRERGGSEAEARRLLDRTRALRAREVDLQRQEEERLLEVLTPSQLLQFHELMGEFNDAVRRLEMQRGRPGQRIPPGGGTGPGTGSTSGG